MEVSKKKIHYINRLIFPNLLQKQSREKPEEWFEEPLKDIIEEMSKMAEGLLPFKEKCEQYYESSVFVDAMIREEEFLQLDSWDDYERVLREKPEDEIKRLLIQALLRMDGEATLGSETGLRINELLSNQFALLDSLNAMPLDDATRWFYFNTVTHPRKTIDEFLELHREIAPIFEKVYAQYEEQLMDEVKLFRERLAENPQFLNQVFSGITEITQLPIDSEQMIIIPILTLTDFLGMTSEKNDFEFFLLGGKFIETMDLLSQFRKNQEKERISIFKNLGDPTRYEIIRQIASGEKSVKKIAEAIGITSATVTYHINQMLISDLIRHNWNKKDTMDPINREMLERAIDGMLEDLQLKS